MPAKRVFAIAMIFVTAWCGFVYPFGSAAAQDPPVPTLLEISALERQLLEEVLALDSRMLRLTKEHEALAGENAIQKKALEQKRRELSALDGVFKKRQRELGSLIRFSYEGGQANLLAVLLGSVSLGDFFRRADNIWLFLEYYNNIIVETRSIITDRRREEFEIMENQRRIEELEQQTREALEEMAKTMAQKQAELARARLLLKDTAFLDNTSAKWQEALPSLDYLLRNLSGLPWNTLSPDDLKVNYFNLSARAEFRDESLRKKLLTQDEKLKDVTLEFNDEGITVTEQRPGSNVPVYSITCALKLLEDQKIMFIPVHLEFNGVTLAPKVIDELMADYTMVFVPPTLPYDLQITSISTEKGKLIMNLKK